MNNVLLDDIKFKILIVEITMGMQENETISHMGKSYSQDGMPALGPVL